MQKVSGEKDVIISHISALIDNLIQSDSLFQELDKDEMIELLSTLLDERFSPEKLRAMPDDDLLERIRGVMAVEVMTGLISDFTPEQIEEFDAAVSRRHWR